MMETNTLLTTLAEAKHRYDSAVARGMGIAGEKERLKNTLFNCYADIVAKLGEIEVLQGQIEFLNGALDDADNQLTELRRELNGTTPKAAEPQPKGKAKAKAATQAVMTGEV